MTELFTNLQYVGIDVSKNFLDIGLLPENTHWQIPNTKKDVRQLIKKLSPKAKVLLESTGGYERNCAEQLDTMGLSVCVINPRLVFHFRKSHNQSAKTDAIDAMILAQYAKERPALRYGLSSKKQQTLIDYEHCLSHLKQVKQATSDRAIKAPILALKRVHLRVIKQVEKELETLEAQMIELIEGDQEMKVLYRRLQTVPGVALTLVASLPELGHISHKAIARLVGVAPIANDSGLKTGKRFIQGGRENVRRAIYMAALVGIRHNPLLKTFYEKKVQEGKVKKVALIACMNKLTHILNSMVANGTDFMGPEQTGEPALQQSDLEEKC